MITWNNTILPEAGQTVWAMDEDQGIGLAVFDGVDKYIHQSGFHFIGIKWWAKVEEINLPE